MAGNINTIYDPVRGLFQVRTNQTGSMFVNSPLIIEGEPLTGAGVLSASLVTDAVNNISGNIDTIIDTVNEATSSLDALSSSYILTSGALDELSASYLLTSASHDDLSSSYVLTSASLDPNVAAIQKVFTKSDFPTPVGGIIELSPGIVYEIEDTIILGTDVLVGNNATLLGKTTFATSVNTSSTSSLFTNNTLDGVILFDGLVMTNNAGPIFNVTLNTGSLNFLAIQGCVLDGGGTGSLGTISGAERFIVTDTLLNNFVEGMVVSGTVNEVTLDRNFFDPAVGTSSPHSIKFDDEMIGGPIVINGTNFKTQDASDISICVENGIELPEPIRINNCIFRGSGSTLDPAGITGEEPKVVINNCFGENDSIFASSIFFNSNSDVTVITDQSVLVNVGEGTPAHTLFTTGSINDRFTLSGSEAQNQELTYNGLIERAFRIVVDAEMDKGGGGSLNIQICILVNDVLLPDSAKITEVTSAATYASTTTFSMLSPGDTIKACVSNETDTANFTIKSMKISVNKI